MGIAPHGRAKQIVSDDHVAALQRYIMWVSVHRPYDQAGLRDIIVWAASAGAVRVWNYWTESIMPEIVIFDLLGQVVRLALFNGHLDFVLEARHLGSVVVLQHLFECVMQYYYAASGQRYYTTRSQYEEYFNEIAQHGHKHVLLWFWQQSVGRTEPNRCLYRWPLQRTLWAYDWSEGLFDMRPTHAEGAQELWYLGLHDAPTLEPLLRLVRAYSATYPCLDPAQWEWRYLLNGRHDRDMILAKFKHAAALGLLPASADDPRMCTCKAELVTMEDPGDPVVVWFREYYHI